MHNIPRSNQEVHKKKSFAFLQEHLSIPNNYIPHASSYIISCMTLPHKVERHIKIKHSIFQDPGSIISILVNPLSKPVVFL